MVDAIWYVLVYYFGQIKFEKVPLFIRKKYRLQLHTPGYTLAKGYFAP